VVWSGGIRDAWLRDHARQCPTPTGTCVQHCSPTKVGIWRKFNDGNE
jgi:hypothetical protein